MTASKTSIQHQREQLARLFRSRCLFVALFFLTFALVLLGRLIQLQWSEHKHYALLSRHNLLTYIPQAPTRGLIQDRHGQWLAINKPISTLSLMPDTKAHLSKTLLRLQQFIALTPHELDNFYRNRHQYRHYQPIPLKENLTEKELADFYTNQYRLPGALIQTQLIRYYPAHEAVGQLIGYLGKINEQDKKRIVFANYQAQPLIGKTGIEKQYETLLHGKTGALVAETNANGHIIQKLNRVNATSGHNVILTLDLRLQKKARELLNQQEGSIVMLDPRNGDILSMVSAPSFDNNLFSGGISSKHYRELLNDPNHPLFNRTIRGRFAPGSTIKPIYALMALSDHTVKESDQIFDRGTYRVPGTQHVYHDWKRSGHGWVNLFKAIQVSCDVYFYQLANTMGIRKIDTILFDFGFGHPLGVDFPHELSGIVPTPQWKKHHVGKSWYTGDTIETGIGQGFFSVTPLQLASAIGALGMEGQHFKPHLLKSTALDGKTIDFKPQELPPINGITHTAWKTVVAAMQSVIDGRHGTAVRFGPHPNFTVAGKTGTAQVYGHTRDEERTRKNLPKKLRNNHLFVAFAPAHHPRVAIAVVMEHTANADKKAGILLRYFFKLEQQDKQKKGHHEYKNKT